MRMVKLASGKFIGGVNQFEIKAKVFKIDTWQIMHETGETRPKSVKNNKKLPQINRKILPSFKSNFFSSLNFKLHRV